MTRPETAGTLAPMDLAPQHCRALLELAVGFDRRQRQRQRRALVRANDPSLARLSAAQDDSTCSTELTGAAAFERDEVRP